jgi:hypothetical protein
VDYRAGISAEDLEGRYADLKLAVTHLAAAHVLRSMLAGMSQQGTDVKRSISGVSHSFSGGPTAWARQIDALVERDRMFRRRWKEQMLGPGLTFVG